MTQMDVSEAAGKLADLIKLAQTGEEVVIADQGQPVARIVAADENPRAAIFGMYKGQIWMSDDFNAPLTDEELKEWGV